MRREPLTSSALASAGYDPDRQLLEIEFRSGRVYRYREVPPGVYAFLLRTKSKGAYVTRMIDGQYAHEEITPEPPQQDVLRALEASVSSVRAGGAEHDSEHSELP